MDTIEIKRIEEVATLIQSASEKAASVFEAVRLAAIAAAEQIIIPMGITGEQLKPVLKAIKVAYADDWGEQAHLVAQFNAVATVRWADSQPISFSVERTVDGNKVKQEQHTTGTEAASALSKNDMVEAAKAVRSDAGIANAEGGGRGPDQNRNGPVTEVFSVIELKSQFSGLFKNSANPAEVLNVNLAQYGLTCVTIDEYAEFKAWREDKAKPAAKRTRAKKAA